MNLSRNCNDLPAARKRTNQDAELTRNRERNLTDPKHRWRSRSSRGTANKPMPLVQENPELIHPGLGHEAGERILSRSIVKSAINASNPSRRNWKVRMARSSTNAS